MADRLKRKPPETFGIYNNLRSNNFASNERILDLRNGVLDAEAQVIQNTLSTGYTVDSLSRFGNRFNAKVIAVAKAVPARHKFPELYSAALNLNADGVPDVGEYYLFFLRMEIDQFMPDPDAFAQSQEEYVEMASLQGEAISEKRADEMMEVFGVGDVVEVVLPNQNSYRGARVTKVITRNNFESFIPPPQGGFLSQFFGGGGGPFGWNAGANAGSDFGNWDQNENPEPFQFPTDSSWTSRFKPGIDISAWNTPEGLDWNTLYSEGIRWVIIKASEGSSRMDRVFNSAVQHTRNIIASGKPFKFSYYHFARADIRGNNDHIRDAEEEARFFLQEVEAIEAAAGSEGISNDRLLPICLDIETVGGLTALKPSVYDTGKDNQNSEADGLTREQLQEWIQTFINVIKTEREPPIIYMSSNFSRNGLGLGNRATVLERFRRNPEDIWTQYALWEPRYLITGNPFPGDVPYGINISQGRVVSESPISSPWAFTKWDFVRGTLIEGSSPPQYGNDANWTIWQFTGGGILRGDLNAPSSRIDLNIAKADLFNQSKYPVKNGRRYR